MGTQRKRMNTMRVAFALIVVAFAATVVSASPDDVAWGTFEAERMIGEWGEDEPSLAQSADTPSLVQVAAYADDDEWVPKGEEQLGEEIMALHSKEKKANQELDGLEGGCVLSASGIKDKKTQGLDEGAVNLEISEKEERKQEEAVERIDAAAAAAKRKHTPAYDMVSSEMLMPHFHDSSQPGYTELLQGSAPAKKSHKSHSSHKMLKSMKHRLKRWKKRAHKTKKKFTAAQVHQAKRAAHAADAAHTAEIVSAHVAGKATKGHETAATKKAVKDVKSDDKH